jgi:hypothetical protein
MKTLLTTLAAALLVVSFTSADAAMKKHRATTASKQLERSCKARAAQKYSVIHFMERRNYVKRCMGEKA